MNKERLKQKELKDRERYFDNVVLKVVQGVDFGFWSKLIDFIMTANEQDYIKYKQEYPELLNAIDRYNKIHNNVKNEKLVRRCK